MAWISSAAHRTAPLACRAAGDGRAGRSVDHSDRYLVAASTSTLVALIGAVLLLATHHDVAGTVLLLGGDAMVIIVWVAYLRRL